MAEGVGFEPTDASRHRAISSRVHSTALPPLLSDGTMDIVSPVNRPVVSRPVVPAVRAPPPPHRVHSDTCRGGLQPRRGRPRGYDRWPIARRVRAAAKVCPVDVSGRWMRVGSTWPRSSVGTRTRHGAVSARDEALVSPGEAGFERLAASNREVRRTRLAERHSDSAVPLLARSGEAPVSPERASDDRGLASPACPHDRGLRVGVVDPARTKARRRSTHPSCPRLSDAGIEAARVPGHDRPRVRPPGLSGRGARLPKRRRRLGPHTGHGASPTARGPRGRSRPSHALDAGGSTG